MALRPMLRVFLAGTPAVAFSTTLLLAGCTVLPKDSPTGEEIRNTAEVQVRDWEGLSFALVKLGPRVVDQVAQVYVASGFSRLMSNRAAARVRVGIGDTIAVTIFEAPGGRLFLPLETLPRAGNYVQLPVQQVDSRGTIVVPYAGEIAVIGRNSYEVAQEIERRLRDKAVEPQAVVTVNERRSSQVSVLGAVGAPNKFIMDPGGLRVLDALARAGGSRHPAFESVVTVKRGPITDRALLTTIVKHPTQNISLLPDDVVFVSREPRIFLAFGATPPPGSIGGQNNRRFIFEDENLTLAEGVAKAGGLETLRADPQSVFLFRMENREVLQRVGIDVSRFPGPLVPTVYTVDLRTAGGFFLANNFYMHNRDIILVSEAPSADWTKFLILLRQFTGPAVDATTIALQVQSLVQ